MVRHAPKSPGDETPVIYLFPSDIHVSTKNVILRTVLGSCVSVVLWEPNLKIGGMNHFLLSKTPENEAQGGRYGDGATRILIRKMLRRGVTRGAIKAKVFGGAGIFGSEGRMGKLGLDNVAMALSILGEENIQVIAKDVGGKWGRRLIFRLEDGATSCVRLRPYRRS